MKKIKELKSKLFSLPKAKLIPILVAGILVAGVASAALLTVYVNMTGTSQVKQSVVFAGYDTAHEYLIGDSPAHAGNTYINSDILYNTSETTAPIKFVTQYFRTGHHEWQGWEPGINTTYWSTVELENKTWTSIDDPSTWVIGSGDGIKATLTYNLISPTFDYELSATGLQIDTGYSLIYYADEPKRFENWGGANPGALIGTFTTDEAGNIYTEGTESQPVKRNANLGMNLPASPDWNATAEANYCESDNYNLCRGAKIWLVPTDEYTSSTKTVKWTDPGSYLFETDLITYSDSNTSTGETLYLGTGNLNFLIKNVLDIALVPGEYKVKTEIIPAQ